MLIDQTGEADRAMRFDINDGWSAGGGVWADPLPPRTNLVPLLAGCSRTLATRLAVATADVGRT